MLSYELEKLFCEGALDLLVRRAFDRRRVRVRRLNAEFASRLALDVKGELEPAVLRRQLQPGELRRQTRGDRGLNLLLQFLARGRLQRRHRRIGGVRNESAFGLRLNAIGKLRDQALEFHRGAIVARPPKLVLITSVPAPTLLLSS